MAGWNGEHLLDSLVTLNPRHMCSVAPYAIAATTGTSANWTAANRAIYTPFRLSTSLLLTQLWWHNGTVVGPPNVDCGVYVAGEDGSMTRVISTGTTVQGTSTTIQAVDVTDTTLQPGVYYMAFAMDANSSGIFRFGVSTPVPTRSVGAVLQETAFPLPATATPTAMIATAAIPVCGLTTRAVI